MNAPTISSPPFSNEARDGKTRPLLHGGGLHDSDEGEKVSSKPHKLIEADVEETASTSVIMHRVIQVAGAETAR